MIRTTLAVCLLLGLVLATPVFGQEAGERAAPEVLADWFEDHGITFEVVYTGEAFRLLSGGAENHDDCDFRGLLDLSLTFDLEALGAGPGQALVLFPSGHGTSISEEFVGDLQALSNIDAHDFAQISELWVEPLLFEERLRLKIGKQDANADFCALDAAGTLLGSSFGFTWNGPLAGRADDVLSFGVAWAVTSDDLDDVDDETAIELTYAIAVLPGLTVQPDLQYILEPGGVHDDAFVFGARIVLPF